MIEKIEAYIEGRLAGEPLAEFEAKLRSDTSFHREVEEFRVIIEGIRASGEARFAQQVARWEREAQAREAAGTRVRPLDAPRKAPLTPTTPGEEPPSTAWAFPWKWTAAVAAAVLLLLAIWLLPKQGTPSAQTLYASHFEPYPDLITQMDASQSLQEEAMAQYNSGNALQALTLFGAVLEDDPDNDLIRLYMGVSHMQINELDEAIRTFDQLIQGDVPSYREPAEWYKALALLKAERKEACRDLLQSIAQNDQHDYALRARKLLDLIS